jgi:hypothetical protein
MFLAALVVSVCLLHAAPASAQTTITSAFNLALDKSNSAKAPPSGTSRVAVFNIGIVLSKYQRAAAMKEEMAEEMKLLKEEAKELTDNLRVWQNALQKPDLGQAKKLVYEEKIIGARRRLEDLDRQARVKIGKSQDAGLTMLWKDMREAVKTYSAEHGIGLVIAYGDPIDTGLIEVMPNITRKMQAIDHGAGVPFFVGEGADISEALVELLNRQYRSKKSEPSEQDPR